MSETAPTRLAVVGTVVIATLLTSLLVVSYLQDKTTSITVRSCPSATGAPGETGAPGAVGPVGPPGATGPTGPTGKTGEQGVAGAPGETGAPGITGATGPRGEKGDTGATGAPGADGMCTTVTGAPGINGANGTDAPMYHGSFYSTFTDQLSARYAGQPMRLSNTDSANGVSLVDVTNPTCSVAPYCASIRIQHSGTYNLQFSAQLQKVAGNSYITVDIWLARKNAGATTFINMPWTSTRVFVPNDTDYSVAAWNFFVQANSDDEFALMWSSSDTLWANLRIASGAPSGYPTGSIPPEIPGVIVTVDAVSN